MIQEKEWELSAKKNDFGAEQVLIRDGFGIVIVVSLGYGYQYSVYGKAKHAWPRTQEAAKKGVEGINVHFATNGPVQATWDEWNYINELVEHARGYLEGRHEL